MTPFDYVNSINSRDKRDIMEDDEAERAYVPFMVNRALSYFPETVMHAHRMTCMPHLSNREQYSYLLNIVRPAKRFAKWARRGVDEDIEAVQSYYGWSSAKAQQVLSILTPQQLKTIKEYLDRGGSNEKSGDVGRSDPGTGR